MLPSCLRMMVKEGVALLAPELALVETLEKIGGKQGTMEMVAMVVWGKEL